MAAPLDTPPGTRFPLPGRTLVTIATFNEAENIVGLLDAIFAAIPTTDILVIDDGSPDGTGELADDYAAREPRVHVLHRAGKLGLGTAILAGLRHAREQAYDFAVTMDADFSHPPERLPDLLGGLVDRDVMIGSRYIPGGSIGNWPVSRHVMSRAINIYSRLLLGLQARDCSGGFRAYRVAKLKEIDFESVYSTGYSFEEEFLYRCVQVGCRVGETPIHFENRKAGRSNLDLRETVWALWAILYVAMRG